MGLDLEALVNDALAPRDPSVLDGSVNTNWGLDFGITRSDLYFVDTKGEPLRTNATASHSHIGHESVVPKDITEPHRVVEDVVAAGQEVPSLCSLGSKKRDRKKKAVDRLEKWFGLPKQELTPELKNELMAIKLRRHIDPKRFYKGNDSEKLPTHFEVGVVTYQGGMGAVGGGKESEALNADTGRKKHKGTSLLQQILRDEASKDWTTKQFRQVEQKHQSGREHKKVKKKGGKKGASKRNWKQKRR